MVAAPGSWSSSLSAPRTGAFEDAANWVAAIDDCLALRPEIVVPGHGEIGGADIVAGVRNYIAGLGERGRAATAAGQTPE